MSFRNLVKHAELLGIMRVKSLNFKKVLKLTKRYMHQRERTDSRALSTEDFKRIFGEIKQAVGSYDWIFQTASIQNLTHSLLRIMLVRWPWKQKTFVFKNKVKYLVSLENKIVKKKTSKEIYFEQRTINTKFN